MPLSLEDLLGTPGVDVVFEGAQIGEFADLMDDLRLRFGYPINDNIEIRHVRQAKRIIGRPEGRAGLQSGECIGQGAGRVWTYEF